MALLHLIDPYTGNHYLDIPELQLLSRTQTDFENNPNAGNKKKFYCAFVKFMRFMINYADGDLNTHPITKEQAARCLFKGCRSEVKALRAALFAAREYSVALLQVINKPSLISNCIELTYAILADYELLLVHCETLMFGSTPLCVRHGARRDMNIRDIFFAANQLMFIVGTPSISIFDLRNVQPYVVSLVRQFIEVTTKRAIGLDNITYKNNPNKDAYGFVSQTLKFVKEASSQTAYNMTWPMNADLMISIYKWACGFVHEGYVPFGYVVFFAWDCVKDILTIMPSSPITIYTGRPLLSLEFGDIRISNYNALKTAYEHALDPKGKFIFKWKDIKDVKAYVLSV